MLLLSLLLSLLELALSMALVIEAGASSSTLLLLTLVGLREKKKDYDRIHQEQIELHDLKVQIYAISKISWPFAKVYAKYH